LYVYWLKRLVSLIPVLFVVSIVIFFIIHLTPGDPAKVMLGQDASVEQVQELRQQLGLELPIYEQYFRWIGNAIKGDLGISFFMKEPVTEVIIIHLVPTISLAVFAEIIALLIGIPLGISASTRRGTIGDQSIMGFSLLGMSVPSFLLSLLLLLLIGVQLRLLPIAGYQPLEAGLWNHLKYLIMPAISLGTAQAALIVRMTRASMIEVLSTNFIKTARAKGVKERNVVYKHTLRNAFLPILTVIGQSFGSLIAGAIVVETIFNIPGIGTLVINSVKSRDYNVIQGVVLFVTMSYVFINLAIDMLYGMIDPRVRLEH